MSHYFLTHTHRDQRIYNDSEHIKSCKKIRDELIVPFFLKR